MKRIENYAANNVSIVAYVCYRVSVFAEPLPSNVLIDTFLPSRSLARIGGIYVQTQGLMGGTHKVCH
jgi:hypothetical protein